MLMGLRGTQTDHDGPPLTPLTPPIDLFAPLSLCLYVSLRLCQRRRRSVSCTITLSPLKPPSSLWGSGLYCKELLEKNGWSGVAEVVETKDEDHVFHLFKPNCENAQFPVAVNLLLGRKLKKAIGSAVYIQCSSKTL
ncbi:putative carboxylesterase 7 [Glycine soja]